MTWQSPSKFRWLSLLLLIAVISAPGALNAASTAKPAIVLAAFGTTTAAFDTYNHFETKVRERFPGYEIRWAFTSRKVRHKVAEEKGQTAQRPAHDLKGVKSRRIYPGGDPVAPHRAGGGVGQESRAGKPGDPRPQSRLGKTAAEQPPGSGASPPGPGPDLSQGPDSIRRWS